MNRMTEAEWTESQGTSYLKFLVAALEQEQCRGRDHAERIERVKKILASRGAA